MCGVFFFLLLGFCVFFILYTELLSLSSWKNPNHFLLWWITQAQWERGVLGGWRVGKEPSTCGFWFLLCCVAVIVLLVLLKGSGC